MWQILTVALSHITSYIHILARECVRTSAPLGEVEQHKHVVAEFERGNDVVEEERGPWTVDIGIVGSNLSRKRPGAGANFSHVVPLESESESSLPLQFSRILPSPAIQKRLTHSMNQAASL